MAEFTKGKWIACDDCTVAVLRDDIHIHCFVAECSSDYPYIDDDEAKANSRLIAEAPVMYDLLGKAWDALPDDHPLRYEIDAALCHVEGVPVPGEDEPDFGGDD